MTEISLIAPHWPHTTTIDRGPARSRQTDPPREARVRQDTVAMDWPRLRTIVDALLRRAAASKDDATAIAAKTAISTPTSPAEQEPIHG
jgi:hypothetical protein